MLEGITAMLGQDTERAFETYAEEILLARRGSNSQEYPLHHRRRHREV